MKNFNQKFFRQTKNLSKQLNKTARELTDEFEAMLPAIKKYLLSHIVSIIKVLLFAVLGGVALQRGYSMSYSVLVSQDPLLGFNEIVPVRILAREKVSGKVLSDLEYNIDLLPITKAQTHAYDILFGSNEDDVLVKIEPTEYVEDDVIYEVIWPGKVGFPIAAGLIGDLEAEIIEETDNYTRITADNFSGLPREAYSKDYFFFFWRHGKEEINFSDREIRLKIEYPVKFNYVQITFLSAEQIIQEVPLPEELGVDANYGGVTHFYKGRDLIVIYTEVEKKSEGQYNLIISGILLSVGTTLLLQAFIDLFDLLKDTKLTTSKSQADE